MPTNVPLGVLRHGELRCSCRQLSSRPPVFRILSPRLARNREESLIEGLDPAYPAPSAARQMAQVSRAQLRILNVTRRARR